MAQAALKMDGLIPNPPRPTPQEVEDAVMRMALKEIEPEMRDVVSMLLYAERLAEGWNESCRKLVDLANALSARDLDLGISTFGGLFAKYEQELAPLLEKVERGLADLDKQPPSYRASFGEVWRRYKIAILAVKGSIKNCLRVLGAEKAERYPGTFAEPSMETLEDEKADALAAQAYKFFAEKIYGRECGIALQDLNGERSFIVTVPVPADMERPHRVLADEEERVQALVEALLPNVFGRSYIRYVRSGDAA